jgi:hypothetical protein
VKRKRGRPPVLDEVKRKEILAIFSVGCSQTTAARYVGCSPSTIRATAERDVKFAEQIGRAVSNSELGLVRNIRDAAKKEQYWRAAAWALERGFPEKYARRGPDVITIEQIAALLASLTEIVFTDVPEQHRKGVVKKMDVVARRLGIKIQREAANDRP